MMGPVMVIAAVALMLVATVVIVLLTRRGRTPSDIDEDVAPVEAPPKTKPKAAKVDRTAPKQQASSSSTSSAPAKAAAAESEMLYLALKGHQERVVQVRFSESGEYLLSAALDHTVRVWISSSFVKGKDPIYMRLVTEFDQPSALAIHSAANTLAVAMTDSKEVKFWTLEKNKKDAKPPLIATALSVAETKHNEAITTLLCHPNCASPSTLTFTCCLGTDTRIHAIAGKSGDILQTINTHQLKNHMIALSPDGRFLVTATMLGEVKVWEVVLGKNGEFSELRHALDLKGHKKAVQCADFSKDGSVILTATADGEFHLWDIAVRYQQREDAKLKLSVKSAFNSIDLAAISHPRSGDNASDAKSAVVCVTHQNTVAFYSVTGQHLATIPDAHSGRITSISFAPGGKYLASCGHDKIVKIWTVPR